MSSLHSLPTWLSSKCERYDPIVVLHPERCFVDDSARIDSFVKLECAGGMFIGKTVHIASFCHLGIGGGRLYLEDGSSFASGVKIVTGSNLYGKDRSCSAVDPTGVIGKSFVIVRHNAVVFAGAIILPGVTIGRNSVVAAGSVVRCDVPDFEVWAGAPARKVKDVEHDSVSVRPVALIERSLVSDNHPNAGTWVSAIGEFYEWPR